MLIGAGHAHLEVLRRLARHPIPGVSLTVLTREPQSPYSGMLPGLVAGQYTVAEGHVAVAPLVHAAGGTLVLDEAIGLDPVQRRVLTRTTGLMGYDTVSLDIGSRPNSGAIAGAAAHAVPVKPIDRFLARLAEVTVGIAAGTVRQIAVVGGGAAGVELILALEHRHRADGVGFTLVCGGTEILPGYPAPFRRRLAAILDRRGVAVVRQAVSAVGPGWLETPAGRRFADAVLLTTGAAPPGWLRGTGLVTDAAGFLRVGPTLQSPSDPRVFAAGDIIAFEPEIPRSGVFAVRAGPVLAHNLAAAFTGSAMHPFRPQRHWLTIINDGDGGAVATRNGLVASGAWVHAWKDRIDRRFMAQYRL